jgi:hypothetical protein
MRHSRLSPTTHRALLTRLDALALTFPASTPLAALLDEMLDAVMLATDAERGNVQLVNPSIGALEVVAQRGFAPEFLDFFAIVRLTGSACAAAFREGRSVVISDVALDPEFDDASRRVMLRANARAVQSTPLIAPGGHIIGVVSTHHPDPTVIVEEALDLAVRFAGLTASVIARREACHGGGAGVRSVATTIHHKVLAGILPRLQPAQLWAGYGDGTPCSGCELTIMATQPAWEFSAEERSYRFHLRCYEVWRRVP